MWETKQRTIKLHCPIASKTVEMAVSENERVDLGIIGRAFGLETQSVKLNSHFIASVTWKSLISCFSSKGLSGDIVVHGKLSSVGTKRGIEKCGELTNAELLVVKKRIKEEDNSGEKELKQNQGKGLKRKQLLDGLSLLKRLRINETCTVNYQNGVPDNTSRANLSRCSPGGGIKRPREIKVDDEILAVPYKKVM